MKQCLLIVFVCFSALAAQAQGQGNVWAFGYGGGLDFNSGSPVPIQTNMSSLEGCASICNKNGQLLFYTEGSTVWNRNGDTMLNGNNLTGLPDSFITPTASTTQGTIIVPVPDSAGKYYIFSLSENEEGLKAGRLYYSVVDMDLDGGLGDIVVGRKGIIIDSGLTEKMTAVVGDRCDIWLLVHSISDTAYKAFEITDAGINFTPVISHTGLFGKGLYEFGMIKVSPNKKKLIGAAATGVEMCDFNAATGIVSNALKLNNSPYYGACFSPDNSKLYIASSADGNLYQYDLSSNDITTISNSKFQLDSAEGDIKIGPDGKIYTIRFANGGTMGVVNFPNHPGATCQFYSSAIQVMIPTPERYLWIGLPAFIPLFVRDTAAATSHRIKICYQDSAIIYANDSGWDYRWDDSSIQTYRTVYSGGNYVVHYYTPPCVYHTDTFIVTFSPPLPQLGSLPGCYGMHNGKAWIQPSPGDTTTYTYTWMDTFGEVLQPTATSSVIADTLYDQLPGNYLVSIKASNSCDTSIPVTIDAPVNADFIHAADTGMCPHDTITLHATGGVAYHWQADSGAYISDTLIADPQVSPPTGWSYTVYGVNSSGCLDTATARVQVFPAAVVQLPDSVVLYYGESFRFSPQTNCLTFNWFPPQGLNADDVSDPIADPLVDTRYIVIGTTEEGCSVKGSVDVYRSAEVILTLPNAFTPGNGPDNLFMPIHKGNVALDYLRIYNRWGQLLYESNDLNQGWDGTWHGIPQPEGVYVYIMQGHTSEDRILTKQGNVTLIR